MGMIDSGYTSNTPSAYVGQTIWHDHRSYIPAGFVASDGLLLSRDNPLFKLVQAGRVPVCTELEWWADPKKRGCYTMGTDGTNFRIPDRNGVQSGSFIAPVLRGDAGATSSAGVMQQNAAPNIAGYIPSFFGFKESAYTGATGAIGLGGASSATPITTWKTPEAGEKASYDIVFNASKSSAVYQDGVTELRMNSVVGCYIICFAGKVQNEELLDALTLATRIEQVNSRIIDPVIMTGDDATEAGWITWTASKINATPANPKELTVCIYPEKMEISGIVRLPVTGVTLPINLYKLNRLPAGKTSVMKGHLPCSLGLVGSTAASAGFTRTITSIDTWVSLEGTTSTANWGIIRDVIYFS